MANDCYTHVSFYSQNLRELTALHDRMFKIYTSDSRENEWLGTYVKEFFPDIDIDDVNCRGSIIEFDEEIQLFGGDGGEYIFSICTDDAWTPKVGVWNEVVNHFYPGVSITYKAEEPGCDLYAKWDPTGILYPDMINVDGYVPTKDGDCGYLVDELCDVCDNLDVVRERLAELLPFEFTLETGANNISERLEEYLNHHPEIENKDEYWVSVGVYEEYPPNYWSFRQ